MVFPDQTDRKNKQNYLRENIIEKGFDGEEFCEFLEKFKVSGADIDNWTFNDLETMVDIFKREKDDPNVTSKFKLQELDLDVFCKDKINRIRKMRSIPSRLRSKRFLLAYLELTI